MRGRLGWWVCVSMAGALWAVDALSFSDIALADEPAANQQPSSEAKLDPRLEEHDRLLAAAKKLHVDHNPPGAIAAANKVVAIDRELFAKDPAKLADSLAMLADWQLEHDDFDAARQTRQEVLAIRTKLNGNDHWQTTDARLALADVERWSKFTVDQRKQLDRATELFDQGDKLGDQGKYQDAIPLLTEVLRLRERVLPDDHPMIAVSINYLANLHYRSGKYVEALPLFERALKIREKTLGPEHPDTAQSLRACLKSAVGSRSLEEVSYAA